MLADIPIQKLGRSVSLFRNSIRVSEKNRHQGTEITFKNTWRSNYTRCLRKRNSSLPKMGLPLLLDLSASPISLCLALFVWTLSRPSAQNSTDLPPSFAVVGASREQAIGVRGTTTPASIPGGRERGSARPMTPHRGGRGVPSTSPQRWRLAGRQGYKLVAPRASTGIGTLLVYRGIRYCCSIGKKPAARQQFILGGFPICASWHYEDKVSDLQNILTSKLEVQTILEYFLMFFSDRAS